MVDQKDKANDATKPAGGEPTDPAAAADDRAVDSGEDAELLVAPERGSVDELLDAGAHDELDAMRHSTAHVMAEAVLDLFPGTKLGIGPAVAEGFYYDFDIPRRLTPDDLATIEDRMRASVAADHRFVRREAEFDDARAVVEGQDQAFKVEILDDLAAKAKAAGEAHARGELLRARAVQRPVPRAARRVPPGRSGRSSSCRSPAAYWRGDEKRPMLQRIYGTVWRTDEELKDFLWRREEAKKRDHRRLGVQLDLFSFHDVSPAMAFWHPKGQLIWRTLEGVMRELQDRRGYQEVSTPIVVSEKLWRQSGHWDLYQENMFLIESGDQTYSLKPMNCPESTFIYRSRRRSYRDLPLRYSRVRTPAPGRAVRLAVRADAGAPVHPGRRPHLRAAGPAHGRDPGDARRGPRGLLVVRAEAPVQLRDEAGQGDRRPGALGARGAAHDGGLRGGRHQLRAEAQGRHVLCS